MILDELRKKMIEEQVDFYIIPTLDPHGSEYLPDYYRERAFVTGFTGSAGTALVTKEKAYLWTDGRYFIQAERQIKDNGFELMKMGVEGYPTLVEYIKNTIQDGQTIGMNFKYYLERQFEVLEQQLSSKKIKIADCDLIKDLWTENRPGLPKDELFILGTKFSGKTLEEKLEIVRTIMAKNNTDTYLLTSLNDICWLYNIRCNDIECTPVAISYALITLDKAYLFIDQDKVNEEVRKELEKFIIIKDYNDVFDMVSALNDRNIYLDKRMVNHALFSCINNSNKILDKRNITEDLKAVKNDIELENIRKCTVRDGVAVTKFIYWLKNIVKEKSIPEIDASNYLRSLREQGENFLDDSFGTIAAYRENAAMAHYSATSDNFSMIKPEGFLLVDSGAQYFDGTTDITRTIVLGECTEEEVNDYTLVLKSHLGLMSAVFLKGTSGKELDMVSRYPIWKAHKDYKHGTGHGVGFVLGVHEGPHSISTRGTGVPLVPGMTVSNEPGMYIEGKYGIRHENIVEVVEDQKNEFGEFYKFDNLTYVPFDREAINLDMMNDDEIECLNAYHAKVYEKISPFLNDEEKEFLKYATEPLVK